MQRHTNKEPSTLSVMTVVLPQSKKPCENCECLCGTINMTKNNLPHRCPFLKGCAEPRRYLMESHPINLREWESLREAACFWKEKYDRLYESQRRLQKVNEGLEEKLLKIAEKFENEKSDLTRDVSDLTSRLVESRLAIAELEEENEQYRNDCSIAVRLLQCKPSNFVAHKFNSLPADFQEKVKKHLSRCNRKDQSVTLLQTQTPDVRTIKVSVPTLPPANMVYSVNHKPTKSKISNSLKSESTPDHVSAAIIAKVLEERGKERTTKKQRTGDQYDVRDSATQTFDPPGGEYRCRCAHLRPRSHSLSSTDSGNVPSKHGSSSSTETAI